MLQVGFKNCTPFKKCRTEINETFVDDAEHINIAMPMYNLIEYSNNYSDTSGSLWQFKRDEIEGDVDLTVDDSSKIPKCSEFEAKSKIEKIFKKHNHLEKYSVKIYEIDSYFYKHYENKYKLIIMV